MDSRADADAIEATLACRIANARPGLDGAAEDELCRRMAPRLRLYGLRHLRDPHAAADLVQQVLLATVQHLRAGRVREPAMIASYMLGMARTLAIDQRRTAARRDALLAAYADDVPAADPAVAPRLDRERLHACLERLPERDRSVLVLTFLDDRPAAEVGRELGLTEGNVRVIRHRGLARLRACMGVELPP